MPPRTSRSLHSGSKPPALIQSKGCCLDISGPLHDLPIRVYSRNANAFFTTQVLCGHRYTKQRAKPPRTPRGLHSGSKPPALIQSPNPGLLCALTTSVCPHKCCVVIGTQSSVQNPPEPLGACTQAASPLPLLYHQPSALPALSLHPRLQLS